MTRDPPGMRYLIGIRNQLRSGTDTHRGRFGSTIAMDSEMPDIPPDETIDGSLAMIVRAALDGDLFVPLHLRTR